MTKGNKHAYQSINRVRLVDDLLNTMVLAVLQAFHGEGAAVETTAARPRQPQRMGDGTVERHWHT
jgi:hypothetical protein